MKLLPIKEETILKMNRPSEKPTNWKTT